MKPTLALVILFSIILKANANIVGEIDLAGQTLYVWRSSGSVTVQNNTITMQGESGVLLLQNEVTVIGPEDYYQVIHFLILFPTVC